MSKMSFDLKIIKNSSEPAEFISGRILENLSSGRKVLWLVPGGSAIPVAVQAAKLISSHPHGGLTVTLTDERYGAAGHPDSNWRQLAERGFKLAEGRTLSFLTDRDVEDTTVYCSEMLAKELEINDYKIGLFGIGKDGHTAGLLPVPDEFERISITPELIRKLDEIVLYAEGRDKKGILEDFKNNVPMPAQALKQVPKLTIFYKA